MDTGQEYPMRFRRQQLMIGLLLVGVLILVALSLACIRKVETNPTDLSGSKLPTTGTPVPSPAATPDEMKLPSDAPVSVPDQLGFPQEERGRVATILSARWKDPESEIMLMGRRVVGGLTVLGAVSVSSLNSAILYSVTPDFPDAEKIKGYALAAQDNIYLGVEFKPTSEQKKLVASFYSSPIATAVGDEFAIIREINHETNQSGTIQAWSERFEKILVPFKEDMALKQAALFVD